jgi:hypothetical protein
MNVEIGAEAALFPEKEIAGIAVAVLTREISDNGQSTGICHFAKALLQQ